MYNTAIRKYGLIAGVLMALFLGGLSVAGDFSGSPIKYFKYVLLMAVMYTFYQNYRATYVRRSYILNHISAGARMSMYAALVIVISNTILY
ncbi:MAG: hypothetical protein HKN09_10965, partial [Saprospiraceae bacterium]|nr:hypothetical protein [Saprospiraceae bacterium]